jgi:hypothetical protein
MILRNAITASSSATSEQTANNLPAACGAEAVACTRNDPRKEIHIPLQHAETVGWRKKKHLMTQNFRGCRQAKEEMRKKSQTTPRTTTKLEFSSNLTTPGMFFAAVLQRQRQTHQVASPATMDLKVLAAICQHEQQKCGQSIRASNVNNLSLEEMLNIVVTVVQQIMTDYNGAELEEDKILVIKNCLISYGTTWPLQFIGP